MSFILGVGEHLLQVSHSSYRSDDFFDDAALI